MNMTTTVLLIAVFVVSVGIALFRSNPNRFANQVFTALVVVLGLELFFIHKAMDIGSRFPTDGISNPLGWVRASASVKGFFPWLLWLLCESIIDPKNKWGVLWKSAPWFSLSLGLALATLSESYISSDSLPNNVQRSPVYIVVGAIPIIACAFLIVRASLQMRCQIGIRRIELQFLVINIAASALLTLSLFALGNILRAPIFTRLSIFSLLGALVLTTWAITYHRIFEVRQVLLSLAQSALLVIFLACVFLFLQRISDVMLPPPLDFLISLGVSCSVAFWLDRNSRRWLGLGGEQLLLKMRRTVIELARTEPKSELLIERFESLLRESCRTNLVVLLFERGEVYESRHLAFAKQQPWHAALCELGWITPESLQRRRSTPALDELRDFLAKLSLGLIFTVPRGSPNPALLLAVGTKTNEAPFTYPEIERLQNIAELMDNILIRSRLNDQAVLQARIEYLALMSRGLAHDLKNLITPVSTFLVHTDGHYPKGSAEEEVHTAARRAMRVMTDYVREAMFFAERFKPNFDRVDPTQLLITVQSITNARAAHRSVTIEVDSAGSCSLVADGVLLQRLLANLVNNAIDASAVGQKISLRSSNVRPNEMRFEVSDEGAGIAPEIRSRIFDPYFTTKEFGDEVRGFGLGLTICQRIVDLHRGKIDVQTHLGMGTTVIIFLPLSQGN